MNTHLGFLSALVLFGAAHLATTITARALDTISLVLIDGDMREDWPDHGVVAIRRKQTTSALTVNFTINATARRNVDYTGPDATPVTLPIGVRETWLEFAPTGRDLGVPARALTVRLQPGAGYTVSAVTGEQAVTVRIENISPLPSAKAAVRFLNQAAFGPGNDMANVQDVMTKGYRGWINAQFARPAGLHQPYIKNLIAARSPNLNSDSKSVAWWTHVMNSQPLSDPLRQRVGFALSEIMVISDRLDQLANQPAGMVNYYDTLLEGAFGNYRNLLWNVARHPCMGIYLNHLGNEKGDPVAGTFADENFAREVMQLFSIGLWELNLDGTRKLDAAGNPIPTYDNHTIASMARVMTGFSFGGIGATDFYYARENYTAPMRMWDAHHDLGAKTLLRGMTLPARQASVPDTGAAGLADFSAAIYCLFHHANTPPFICRQLIQKLVTSNPSPAYVARVAGKFVNNGNGVRGDLKAVIMAILMDSEARTPQEGPVLTEGKLKEPYLQTANLVRALGAKPAVGNIYLLNYLEDIHFQQPLSAPSVFNFFKPGYAPAGPVSEAGLVAPEFQIVNAVTAHRLPNYYLSSLQYGFNRWGDSNPNLVVNAPYTAELPLAANVPALLRRLDLLLTGGTLSKEQHQVIREALEQVNSSMYQWRQERVRLAIYLIVTSPEFTVLK